MLTLSCLTGVATEDLMVSSHGFYYSEWYRGHMVPLDIFGAKTRLVPKKEKVTWKVILNINTFVSYSVKIIAQTQKMSSQINSQYVSSARSWVGSYFIGDISKDFEVVVYEVVLVNTCSTRHTQPSWHPYLLFMSYTQRQLPSLQ